MSKIASAAATKKPAAAAPEHKTTAAAGDPAANTAKIVAPKAEPKAEPSIKDALIPIIYIGKKPQKADLSCGTGLTWLDGQTHNVTREQAAMLLRHPDVWADARENALEDPIRPKKVEKAPELDPETSLEVEQPRLDLSAMDAAGLRAMAMREYGREFPDKLDADAIRGEIQKIVNGQKYN